MAIPRAFTLITWSWVAWISDARFYLSIYLYIIIVYILLEIPQVSKYWYTRSHESDHTQVSRMWSRQISWQRPVSYILQKLHRKCINKSAFSDIREKYNYTINRYIYTNLSQKIYTKAYLIVLQAPKSLPQTQYSDPLGHVAPLLQTRQCLTCNPKLQGHEDSLSELCALKQHCTKHPTRLFMKFLLSKWVETVFTKKMPTYMSSFCLLILSSSK